MKESAKFIISFDVELGWGAVENRTWSQKEARGVYEGVRPALSSLLAVLGNAEAPATWAFVGKLLDRDGLEDRDLPPEILRTCRMKGEEKTWRGEDLLDMIQESPVGHEIACHSFYHRRCGERSMNAALFASDLSLCRKIFSGHGLSPVSFVYPSNEERWVEILREQGFSAFRGENQLGLIRTKNPVARKIISFCQLCGMRRIRTEEPSLNSAGLWRIPGTIQFNVREKRRNFLPALVRRVNCGLKRTVKSNGYMHLWSHPYNFSINPRLIVALEEVLALATKLRDAGKLEIMTMQEFVNSRDNSGRHD